MKLHTGQREVLKDLGLSSFWPPHTHVREPRNIGYNKDGDVAEGLLEDCREGEALWLFSFVSILRIKASNTRKETDGLGPATAADGLKHSSL